MRGVGEGNNNVNYDWQTLEITLLKKLKYDAYVVVITTI